MTGDEDEDDAFFSSRDRGGIPARDEASTSANGTETADGNDDALAYASRAVVLRLATREGRADGAELRRLRRTRKRVTPDRSLSLAPSWQ